MSKAAYRKDRILFAFVFVFAYGPTRRVHGDEEGMERMPETENGEITFPTKAEGEQTGRGLRL